MTDQRALRGNESGVAVIEIAIALPVLILFIWGIFQIGIAFHANAGMQHGLGEGARLATLCYNPQPTTGCSTPTNDEIKTRISQKVFGTHVGTFSTPTVTDAADGSNYKDLSVSFTMPMDFLFFQGPNVTLTQSKRVYVAG
jgi:hypothetical protein